MSLVVLPTQVLQLDPAVKEAFDVAYDNIYAFHVSQKLPEKTVENMKVRVVSNVSIYNFSPFLYALC
jgi:hypothetical protein